MKAGRLVIAALLRPVSLRPKQARPGAALRLALISAAVLVAAPVVAQPAPAIAPIAGMEIAPEKAQLRFLDAADLDPQRLLPPPPSRGSEREKLELQTLHAMIAAATPERLAQAAVDGKNETPSIFSRALGHDLAKLPVTWSLLVTVQDEIKAVVLLSKDFFARPRPYNIDATLPTCGHPDRAKATRSYPSGHAGLGWGVGWFLARLAPDRAPAILARADNYAISRQLCAVRFPSDTEASHVLATVVAERLLNDPRLAPRIAAARAELAIP